MTKRKYSYEFTKYRQYKCCECGRTMHEPAPHICNGQYRKHNLEFHNKIMEKELLNTFDKELLLKDLCARLPYGVKFIIDEMYLTEDMIKSGYAETQELYGTTCEGNIELLNMDYHMPIESIKPYLIPLSSMTKEQLFEVQEILGKNEIKVEDDLIRIVDSDRNTFSYSEIIALLEWFYRNHFDINNLISTGLAIDATGLNIY